MVVHSRECSLIFFRGNLVQTKSPLWAKVRTFMGCTVNNEYIACGSETDEAFVYHKEISKPVTRHRFGSPDLDYIDDDAGSYFISAVCWKSDSPTTVIASPCGLIC